MSNLKQIPSRYASYSNDPYRGLELRNLVAEDIDKWLGRGHIAFRDNQPESLTRANPQNI